MGLNISQTGLGQIQTITSVSTTPPVPLSNSEARMYIKGGNLIIQYFDGAVARYKYLPLSGTDILWKATTTAP